MKYKLIEAKSIGEFDATIEMRSNYVEDYKRTKAYRSWEVYQEDSQLLFTVELKEEARYEAGCAVLQTFLYIKLPPSLDKNVQKQQLTTIYDFHKILNWEYCIPNFYSSHHASCYESYIDLSTSKDEYIQKLYEYLKSNKYYHMPSALVEEIDSLAYKMILSEEEIAIYRQIDAHVADDNYELAVNYLKSVVPGFVYPRNQNYDFTCYLGDMLYKKGQLEAAYSAYNAIGDTLFYMRALRKGIACARELASRMDVNNIDTIKWRSIYISNYIRLALDSDDISKQDFNNEMSRHFANSNTLPVIFNPIVGREQSIDESAIVSEIFSSLFTIIDQQNVKLKRLPQPSNSITSGYARHIANSNNAT